MMKNLAAFAAAVLLLAVAGCSSDDQPASTTQQSTTVTSTTPAEPTTPAESEIDGHQVLSAVNVLHGFQAAKLPVRNDRYNDANCETLQLGCIELLTTDDISVYTFAEGPEQAVFAASLGDDGYSSGNVVLSYLAQRTPAAMRTKYQAVLDKLK